MRTIKRRPAEPRRKKKVTSRRRRPASAPSGSAGESVSLCMATETITARPPLARSQAADVCVIGAGIAGLSAAYRLVRAGKSVVVLDDGPIGGGQTGRTTAHLSHAMDVQYQVIRRLHGDAGARLAAESHTAAIDAIEETPTVEGIACDFKRVPGHLFVSRRESLAVLERELEAAHAAGLTRVELLPQTPALGAEAGPCLRFPHQAQFHPLRYLGGLAAAIERHGGRIATSVHVEGVEPTGAAHRVRTRGRARVSAGAVIAATNAPILGLQTIHAKQAAYLSYVIGARVPAGAVPPGLYWDTEDPYHYVRVQRGTAPAASEVLIVGGEDHKTGQADDSEKRYRALEEWARALSDDRGGGVPLVRAGHELAGRTRLHRAGSARRPRRLPGHRRHRDGDDARNDRRPAASRGRCEAATRRCDSSAHLHRVVVSASAFCTSRDAE